MARIDASFIHRPRVPIVNTLHATAEQAARADQEWRHHVAKHRRAKYAHQLEREWAVVVYRPNQDQLLNAVRIVQRASRGDCAAVRATDKNRSWNLENVEQSR